MSILKEINEIIKEAVNKAFPDFKGEGDAKVRTCSQEGFDYQSDFAFGAAKILRLSPAKIAESIKEKIHDEKIAVVEVAGQGFLNIRLADEYLVGTCKKVFEDFSKNQKKNDARKRIVVDYSGPNVAKEMHVGHLRSTILGDVIARMFVFNGDEVIRQNHLGDWGTQFGMLIEYIKEFSLEGESIKELNALYRTAKQRFDEDENFAERARLRVVALQSGDEETLKIWRMIVEVSEEYFLDIYKRLGVLLSKEDYKPESFYNDLLSGIISDLHEEKMLTKSEGAECVFLKEGEAPVIVKKSDGGFLYATTDLAALKYRAKKIQADAMIYVTDARQKQHFEQIFTIGENMHWVRRDQVKHVPFGTILGKDGKPFKTRSGEVVKLADLLNEAKEKIKSIVKNKTGGVGISEEDEESLAVGAVKYADLMSDRERDYIFDSERMIALEGNTGPYLQYCHRRTRAILEKTDGDTEIQDIFIGNDYERDLVLGVARFNDAFEESLKELKPHILCHWIYEIATRFNKFYEECQVVGAEKRDAQSRVAMVALTERALSTGLALLGMKTVKNM